MFWIWFPETFSSFSAQPLSSLETSFYIFQNLSVFSLVIYRCCALILIMSEAFSLSLWDKVHRLGFFQHALIFEYLYPGTSPDPSCTKLLSVQRQGLIHSVPSQMFYNFSKSFYEWFSNQIPLGRGECQCFDYVLWQTCDYILSLESIFLCAWKVFSHPFQ